MAIKFGTDGWRAIMCEDFIMTNVEFVVQGVCNYLLQAAKGNHGLIIGYDTRFFSERFANRAAAVCNGNGIKVWLTETDAPTPVTAFSILSKQTDGALMFTASHNPPAYNGIKFIPENAAPALPEVTDKIEAAVAEVEKTGKVKKMDEKEAREKGLLITFDPSGPYLKTIRQIIDLSAITRAKLKVVYDPLFSTGRNYMPALLKDITDFTVIHGHRDPNFGGKMPDPNKEILSDLVEEMKKVGADIGLANDGDADRFGIIDSDGTFISPNEVISLLYLHLLKNRGLKGDVARTVATTSLVDQIAAKFGCNVVETPVGFKYIGNELLNEGTIIGGEESGGVSIAGHIPEKDGILACILMTEIRAVEGKSFTELLKEVYKEYGAFYTRRVDIHTTSDHMQHFFAHMKDHPFEAIGQLKVIKTSTMDGVKFYLEDGSWVLFRPSGTEPLTRIYMEAHSDERLTMLASEATRMFMDEKSAVGA